MSHKSSEESSSINEESKSDSSELSIDSDGSGSSSHSETSHKSKSSKSSSSSASEELSTGEVDSSGEISGEGTSDDDVSGFSSGEDDENKLLNLNDLDKLREIASKQTIKIIEPKDSSEEDLIDFYKEELRRIPFYGSNEEVLELRSVDLLERIASKISLLFDVKFSVPKGVSKKEYYVSMLKDYPQTMFYVLIDDLKQEINRLQSELSKKDEVRFEKLSNRSNESTYYLLDEEESRTLEKLSSSKKGKQSDEYRELSRKKEQYESLALTKEEQLEMFDLQKKRGTHKIASQVAHFEGGILVKKPKQEKDLYIDSLVTKMSQAEYLIMQSVSELVKTHANDMTLFKRLLLKMIKEIPHIIKLSIDALYREIDELYNTKTEGYEIKAQKINDKIKALLRPAEQRGSKKAIQVKKGTNKLSKEDKILLTASLTELYQMLESKFLDQDRIDAIKTAIARNKKMMGPQQRKLEEAIVLLSTAKDDERLQIEKMITAIRSTMLTNDEHIQLDGLVEKYKITPSDFVSAEKMMYDSQFRPLTQEENMFFQKLFSRSANAPSKLKKHGDEQSTTFDESIKSTKKKAITKKDTFGDILKDIELGDTKYVIKKEPVKATYNKQQSMILDAIKARMTIKTDVTKKTNPFALTTVKPNKIATSLFDNLTMKALSTTFATKNENTEIETSFGYFTQQGKFRPGVTFIVFDLIKSWLTAQKVSSVVTTDIVYTTDKQRKIVSADATIYQTKRRQYLGTNMEYGIRVASSIETDLFEDASSFETAWEVSKNQIIRHRIRTTYSYGSVLIELTTVNETSIVTQDDDTKTYTSHKYEVEVEDKKGDLEQFLFATQDVLMASQMMNNKVFGPASHLVTQEQKRNIEHLKRNLYKERPNNPINIKQKDFWSVPFLHAIATIKLNGIGINVITTNNESYALFPSGDVFVLGNIGLSDKSMFEAEYISIEGNKQIHIFSVLVKDSKPQTGVNARDNYEIVKAELPKPIKSKFSDVTVLAKIIHIGENVYENIRCALQDRTFLPDREYEDGIIINYSTNQGHAAPILKWKPVEKMSIDFLLTLATEEEIKKYVSKKGVKGFVGKAFMLRVGNKGGESIIFKGSKRNPTKEITSIQYYADGTLFGRIPDQQIVECVYEKETGLFVALRYRDDKKKPNYVTIAENVFDDIMDPISERTVAGYSMFLMRKSHMFVKEILMKQYVREGENIVDIGSGRGGTIKLWEKTNANEVFAIEPNKTFRKELYKRLSESNIKDKVEVLEMGAENTVGIKKAIGSVVISGMTAFFSLTFFFENEKKFAGLMKTLSLIPVGGYFVGTVMDKALTEKLLGDKNEYNGRDVEGCQVTDINNTTFKLSRLPVKKGTKMPFGNALQVEIFDETSMVKEVEEAPYIEYLFDFDYFTTAMGKIGFEIHDVALLDENFSMTVQSHIRFGNLPHQSQVFSKLNKAFAFMKK